MPDQRYRGGGSSSVSGAGLGRCASAPGSVRGACPAALVAASQRRIVSAAARLSAGVSLRVPGCDTGCPLLTGRQAAGTPVATCPVWPLAQHMWTPRFHARHSLHAGAPCCGHTPPLVNRPRASCCGAGGGPPGCDAGCESESESGPSRSSGRGGRGGGGGLPTVVARASLPWPQRLAAIRWNREVILQEHGRWLALARWCPQPRMPFRHTMQRESLQLVPHGPPGCKVWPRFQPDAWPPSQGYEGSTPLQWRSPEVGTPPVGAAAARPPPGAAHACGHAATSHARGTGPANGGRGWRGAGRGRVWRGATMTPRTTTTSTGTKTRTAAPPGPQRARGPARGPGGEGEATRWAGGRGAAPSSGDKAAQPAPGQARRRPREDCARRGALGSQPYPLTRVP